MDLALAERPSTADGRLDGRVAVVTGSTSGIGLGIAREFAALGAKVVLNSRKANEESDKLCAEISKDAGVEVVFGAADMSVPDEIVAMMQAQEKKFGRFDIIVNNAGIQHVAHIEDFLFCSAAPCRGPKVDLPNVSTRPLSVTY